MSVEIKKYVIKLPAQERLSIKMTYNWLHVD